LGEGGQVKLYFTVTKENLGGGSIMREAKKGKIREWKMAERKREKKKHFQSKTTTNKKRSHKKKFKDHLA